MRIRGPLIALALTLAAPAHAEEAHLVVLHTTDLHGALTAYDYLADRPAPRGLVKIATLVRAARAEGTPLLLLDAGDCIQGGPLVDFGVRDPREPEPMMAAMNRIGYDAMAVGNHEFSVGPEAMKAARATATFPWLAANIVRSVGGAPAFRPSLVKVAGPLRIGVVGITTPAVPFLEDSARWAGLRFLDPIEVARAETDRLRREERCDAVIVLAHSGLEPAGASPSADGPDENWGRRIARQVPGVDLVILGHTHRVIVSAEVDGALLTQAGRSGEHLGRVDFTFARADRQAPWRLSARQAQMVAVADSIADDPAIAALARHPDARARAALDEVVGEAEGKFAGTPGLPARAIEHPILDLIHRAQLEASGADVSLAARFDTTATLTSGPVTLRDVARLYPYDNTLVTIELTGAELKAVLEHAARAFAPYTFEVGAPLVEPGMPDGLVETAAGVTYTIDLTSPVGERIRDLAFQGVPLGAERRLRVALNSYRASGAGGYPAVRTAPRLWRSDRGIREILIDYIRGQHPLRPAVLGSWHLAPSQALEPERALLDRLVRRGVLSSADAVALDPAAVASRADAAAWIARAFGWRAARASGRFATAPDSLEPWLDGLARRKVLTSKRAVAAAHARRASNGTLDWNAPATRSEVEAWALATARAGGYTIAKDADELWLRGLEEGGALGASEGDATLTRAQVLTLVSRLRYPTLRILETTDFHGAMLHSGSRRPLGSSASLATWIEHLRSENPFGTVLIDGGDCFQGTMISNLAFGRPIIEQMNAIGYQAMAIGNHEFDWSVDTLAQRVSEMRFAALGANMVERKSGRRPRWARTDTVIIRRGLRVGILGLCYTNTPSVTLAKHVAHLRFEDDSTTAARIAPALARRSDLVIGVGHIPASADSLQRPTRGDLVRLARGIPDVDAWFGGHSHNRVVGTIDGKPVMIAGSHGQIVGVCDLVLDPMTKQVLEFQARLVEVASDSLPPDPGIQAIVDRWNALVAPVAAMPLGRNARRLTRERGGESGVGNLVADAIRKAADADVGFQNSGGLRADLTEGTITKSAVFEVMPFDNTIVTVELDAAGIRLALEQGLATGRVTQVSGIRYAFDRSRPAGDRVVDLTDTAGAPLVPGRRYRVAVNDFMATGGDDYTVLTTAPGRTSTDMLVRDALERSVVESSRNGGALDVRLDGRIRVIGRPTDGH